MLALLATSMLGSALKLGARGMASKALSNAQTDIAAVPAKVKLALVAIVAVVVLGFVHQHYARKALDAARTAQRNADQAVLDQTVANYRAAAEQARAADKANAARVAAEAKTVNERNVDEYQ